MSSHSKHSRTQKFADWYGAKLIKHKNRLYLFFGLSLLYVHSIALLGGYYLNATIIGFLGWTFLGGWPTLKRLGRHPIFQLRHWYHVARGTLQIRHVERPDGETRISVMKPTMRNGWGWREVRKVDEENIPSKAFE